MNKPNAHYDVVEARVLYSEIDTDQLVTVGRSNSGVHLTLSPCAAISLAKILVDHAQLMTSLANAGLQHAGSGRAAFDRDLWTHVAVDLEAQKSLHAVSSELEDLAVSVGYLADQPGQDAELVKPLGGKQW